MNDGPGPKICSVGAVGRPTRREGLSEQLQHMRGVTGQGQAEVAARTIHCVRVTRITRIGFEMRVEVATDDQVITVTLPRSEFLTLGLRTGSTVQVDVAPHLRRAQGLTTVG